MKVYNQVLSNLKEDKEEWYDACNNAEQAILKLKNMCSNEEAIKSLEKMILDLNNIRMEQYKALKEYSLVEEELSKANIYQIKDIKNCDYSFEDYYDAKDKINMDDYAEVASISVPKNENALENIFMLGNSAKHEFTVYGPFRSISVSDIIELDGKKYYVDTFGFKEVK